MRPIKFRVWSTRGEHRMIYLPTVLGGGMIKDLEEEENWKVMQFTGLTDREGTEIYQGDIVWLCEPGQELEKSEVRFEGGAFRAGSRDFPLYWWAGSNKECWCTIIGHIYEEPK